MSKPLTRGQKVIAFIETYCLVPEGIGVGKPMRLLPFQKDFILEVYDNPVGTSRAYLSIARKNGKSALIAALVLAHLAGPEAKTNSQIISGARSREQAALIFKLAEKMVMMSSDLKSLIKRVASSKTLIGLAKNVEYRAISAEASTAHGLSPVVAILDEVGQVKGPHDPFIEAIETAQGAYEGEAILIAISTQAATDADMFSIWLDDAASSGDPRIVSHLYSAPEDCDLDDKRAWKAANPALGVFRSMQDVEDFSQRAKRQPSSENTFRWLFLNQRIEASSPFISKSVWQECASEPLEFGDNPVYGGLDLSETADLTALILVSKFDEAWSVRPTFWLPEEGLLERSRKDRVPYDLWHRQGFLQTTPGASIEYEWVAIYLKELFKTTNIRQIAFDRWNFKHLVPWLKQAGFSDAEIEERFVEFGQGFQSMSPALRDLESLLLSRKVRHGGHPVLTMCMANAVVTSNPAGGRKLDKAKSRGRIDGAVALAMAMSGVALEKTAVDLSDFLSSPVTAAAA